MQPFPTLTLTHADGSLAQEALAGGTAVRRMAYDALGRLTGLDDPAFALGLSYRQWCGGGPMAMAASAWRR